MTPTRPSGTVRRTATVQRVTAIRRAARGQSITSWRVLMALSLVAVAAGALGVHTVQQQIETRALHSVQFSSRLVRTLVVEPHVTKADIDRNQVATGSVAALDAAVLRLQRSEGLVGLEVWALDTGTLLYADSSHPDGETRLPADELAMVRAGGFPTQESPAGEGRPIPTLDVMLPYDPDGDGRADAMVEVVTARDPIDASITKSTRILYGGAAAIALLGAVVLWAVRRRQRVHEYAAHHDGLTGLGNRLLLAQHAAWELGPEGTGGPVALLLLDLDRFKEVNDTLGHHAGDELLVVVGGRLRQAAGEADLVVRLGGDEFAVLLPRTTGEADAIEAGRRVLRLLREPVLLSGLAVEVGGSIGVSLAPGHGTTLSHLLRGADVAMYEAKRRGGGVSLYDPETDPREAQQLSLLADLRRGIIDNQLRLHYQPKSTRDGQVDQVEALVRWQHPVRGLIPPNDFVPLVERTSLIKPMTEWVLREAAAQCAAWRAAGQDIRVAVNISPRSLTPELPAMLATACGPVNLPLTALDLEITETAVMVDPAGAAEVLARLRDLGVSVSIDDFGVGNTSLSLLTSLPVDRLKIDRRFVTNILTSEVDEAVVRCMIGLARDLGLLCLAEGVESVEVWERLAELGCDEIQGFVLTKPLPADQLMGWMRDWEQDSGHTGTGPDHGRAAS